MSENVAAIDLPGHLFPFTIEAFGKEDGELKWKITVAEPGVVQIPGKAETGCEVTITVTDKLGNQTTAE